MAENTKIEWCKHTWSPWIGCQKVGPGCDHCYAEALNKRAGDSNWGPGAARRRTSKDYWKKPYRWNHADPGTVFPSMCDPFDNAVDPAWRRDFSWLIRETPNLTWLLLTKRIGNAEEMLREMFDGSVPGNVWLGATVVNQVEVERDIVKLIAAKAMLSIRCAFLSVEPMLGLINLREIHLRHSVLDALTGMEIDELGERGWDSGVDWVICGGESGGGARPMHPLWATSLRDQCAGAGKPFLFKQWGEWAPSESGNCCIAWDDGRHMPNLEPHGHNGDGTVRIARLGKKNTGRLLDGVQHDGFPAMEATNA